MDSTRTYEESRERKAGIGMTWVKADDSESTYLCKTDDLKGIRDMSDSELRSICVDESLNPQND
jgi:hypothetical protein